MRSVCLATCTCRLQALRITELAMLQVARQCHFVEAWLNENQMWCSAGRPAVSHCPDFGWRLSKCELLQATWQAHVVQTLVEVFPNACCCKPLGKLIFSKLCLKPRPMTKSCRPFGKLATSRLLECPHVALTSSGWIRTSDTPYVHNSRPTKTNFATHSMIRRAVHLQDHQTAPCIKNPPKESNKTRRVSIAKSACTHSAGLPSRVDEPLQ